MPNIPPVLEKTDFDALPEQVREYFGEKDGKFYPNFSQGDIEKLAVGLRKNRDDILREKRELEEAHKPYKDLGTIEELNAKLEEAQSGKSKSAQEVETKYKAEIENLKAQVKTQVEALQTNSKNRETALTQSIEKLLVTSEVGKALAAHKGNPKLLEPVLVNLAKVVETANDGKSSFELQILDKEGKPRYADALGTPFAMADLVKEMRNDPEYAPAFYVDNQGGTNATNRQMPGNSGTTFRVSREASKTNPALYQNAKAQADKVGGTVEFTD